MPSTGSAKTCREFPPRISGRPLSTEFVDHCDLQFTAAFRSPQLQPIMRSSVHAASPAAHPDDLVSSTAAKHLLSNSTPIRCRDTSFQVDGLVEKPGHVLRDFQWIPWHETKIEYPGRRGEPPTKNEIPHSLGQT